MAQLLIIVSSLVEYNLEKRGSSISAHCTIKWLITRQKANDKFPRLAIIPKVIAVKEGVMFRLNLLDNSRCMIFVVWNLLYEICHVLKFRYLDDQTALRRILLIFVFSPIRLWDNTIVKMSHYIIRFLYICENKK